MTLFCKAKMREQIASRHSEAAENHSTLWVQVRKLEASLDRINSDLQRLTAKPLCTHAAPSASDNNSPNFAAIGLQHNNSSVALCEHGAHVQHLKHAHTEGVGKGTDCRIRPQSQHSNATSGLRATDRTARLAAQVPVKPQVPRLSKKARRLQGRQITQLPGHTKNLQTGRVFPMPQKFLLPCQAHSGGMCSGDVGNADAIVSVRNEGWPQSHNSTGAQLGNLDLGTVVQWLQQYQHLSTDKQVKNADGMGGHVSQQRARCWEI
jgi:hypothetical protein